MPFSKESVKTYLGYLDKAMTIMGILSTLCVVVLGFAIDKLIFPEKIDGGAPKFWKIANIYCLLGFTSMLIAAYGFYRQRSLLAWYYSQISLGLAQSPDRIINERLTASDGWSNWVWYLVGFWFLFTALSAFACTLLASQFTFFIDYQIWIAMGVLIIWSTIYGFQIFSYKKYSFEDKPGAKLRNSIFSTK